MQRISNLWKSKLSGLDTIIVDESLSFVKDPFVLTLTIADSITCIDEIELMKKIYYAFDGSKLDNLTVLEVGAGCGVFCKTFHELSTILDYTIVDIKNMLRLSKKFLEVQNVKCNFIDIFNCESIFNKKFDLFVANICLSEIPYDFLKYFLQHILPNCKKVSLIDSGSPPFTTEIIPFIKKYVNLDSLPCGECYQVDHYIYFGNVLK